MANNFWSLVTTQQLQMIRFCLTATFVRISFQTVQTVQFLVLLDPPLILDLLKTRSYHIHLIWAIRFFMPVLPCPSWTYEFAQAFRQWLLYFLLKSDAIARDADVITRHMDSEDWFSQKQLPFV
jgi:hypothetical protein